MLHKMLVKLLSILLALGATAHANSYGGRIVNGEDAVDIVPYHAQLGIRLGTEPERAGSGVILTTRLVITAATNIYGYDIFRAGFGSTTRSQLQWANGLVGEVISSYNPVTYENNVGFIIFAVNAFANNYVVPISIPPLTFQQDLPLENEQGRIVGFGWTQSSGVELADTLQVAFNRVVSRADCSSLYGVNQEENFCTVDNVGKSKICAGDQGTAFVTNINGREYLTGIASYIYDYTCAPGVPALFVRTFAYRHYIDPMISLWG